MSEIKTIAAPAHAVLRIKDSRFIADAAPVKHRQEAEVFIETIRDRYPDATHHCFAYRLGTGDSAIVRTYDAREPAGTAGKPILQAIEARRLTDVVVVVTRYFGGTKLGKGGLIRAYAAAAFAVLDEAKIITRIPLAILNIQVSYEHVGAVRHLAAKLEGAVLEEQYDAVASLRVSVPRDRAQEFKEELGNMTAGSAKIVVVGESASE